MATKKKYTLVEAYEKLATILGDLKTSTIPVDTAQGELARLADEVSRTLPGVILRVPTYAELYNLVPAVDAEYESSPQEYEESYESSAC